LFLRAAEAGAISGAGRRFDRSTRLLSRTESRRCSHGRLSPPLADLGAAAPGPLEGDLLPIGLDR